MRVNILLKKQIPLSKSIHMNDSAQHSLRTHTLYSTPQMEEGEEHMNPESGSGYPLGLSDDGFDYGVIEEQSRDSESPIPSGTEQCDCCAVCSTVTKNFDTDATNTSEYLRCHEYLSPL
jgi:hypothetical protein